MDTQQIDEKAIFNAARQIADEAAREDFLTKACGGDEPAIDRVRELLRVHGQMQSFLESPAADLAFTTDSEPIAERPGAVIGPYKLLQKIGEGGMGVVFMAEQTEPIQRTVALKIIKPGMDSRQVIARFEAERQALAMMDHPNIAKVLDAGTTATSRPYFVMDLVKGVPITEYCDRQHYSIRQRLELMAAVCQAVQHAHQKGLIHRDIKPSNVLVAEYDGKPVPKVIDFGVAKAVSQKLTERTMFTEFGQIVGTFEYMSPEQARFNQLDVDTRSDIYSLGVLLYELLAGSTPLEKERLRTAAYDEILRIIGEEEPPRPSTRLSSSQALPSIAANRHTEPTRLSKEVSGELDWIVMKCLEKDRNRRYATANALGIDLQNFLSGDEVMACPPTHLYRLRKFIHKNKLVLATAGAFAAILVAGTCVSVWQAVRATRAQHLADDRLVDLQKASAATAKALEETKQAKKQTEAALAEAKEERSEAEAVTSFIVNAFRSPDPEQDARELKVIDLLSQAATELEKDFDGSARTKGKLLLSLGKTYIRLGLPELAVPILEKARAEFEAAIGPEHDDTVSCINDLALSYRLMGRLDEALPLAEMVLRLTKAKYGADHLETALCVSNLADAYRDAGRLPEAITLGEEALRVRRAISGPDDHETLLSMSNLAQTYYAAGQQTKALSMFEEVYKLRKAKSGPSHPATLACMNNLAIAYSAAGRLDESITMGEDSLDISRKMLGPDHLNTLLAMSTLASVYAQAAQIDKAIPLMEELLKLRKAKLGADHPATLTTMNNLAMTLRSVGRPADALPLLEEALKLRRTKSGSNHPQTIMAINNLANTMADVGRIREALPLFEEAFRLSKDTLGPDHPDTLFIMGNLADVYRETGQLEKSIPLAEETFKLQRAALGPDHLDTLTTAHNLAGAYHDAGRAAEALSLADETYKLRAAKLGPNHPDTLKTLNNLAGFHESADDLDKAIPLFEKALEGIRSLQMPGHPLNYAVRKNLARCYEKKGNAASAEPLLRELVELQQKNAGDDAPETANSLRLLGRNLVKQQKFDDATKRLRESLAIGEKKWPDSWSTFSTKSLLGASFAGQKKYTDAEPLLVEGYQGLKQREAKIPKIDRAELAESLDRLIDFYNQRGKRDEAAKWRKERDALKSDDVKPGG